MTAPAIRATATISTTCRQCIVTCTKEAVRGAHAGILPSRRNAKARTQQAQTRANRPLLCHLAKLARIPLPKPRRDEPSQGLKTHHWWTMHGMKRRPPGRGTPRPHRRHDWLYRDRPSRHRASRKIPSGKKVAQPSADLCTRADLCLNPLPRRILPVARSPLGSIIPLWPFCGIKIPRARRRLGVNAL
ncbi:hypothetical protein GGQ68_003970 [Sagittula marina]|uniref:Uncharacterized protein n=1 Tax=Sagittula marina TaxID=943940 RepID=A0A7W6DR53_9RHOB|nr:hypothetical protein [Sagittula marina]